MDTKFTKGKWEVSFMGNVIDEYGREIVNPENSQMREEETSYNAKLIATAPEMLKELESAKNTISRIKNSMRAHPDCIEHSEFADYVELAEQKEYEIELLIKKATE